MAVNANEIISEVLEKMRLNSTTPVAVTRAQVLRELNNMLRDLAEHTYLFVKRDDNAFCLVSGTRSYALPTDCFDLVRVYDADDKKIYPIIVEQLEDMSRDWVDDDGEPRYFMLGYEGANYVSFYPLPGSDEEGDYIGARYRYYETDLTDATISTLPVVIGNNKQLAVDWCLGKLLMDKTEVQDQQLGLTHLNGYYNERRKWESKPKAPEKLRVMGQRGAGGSDIVGPKLPDDYPAVRLW